MVKSFVDRKHGRAKVEYPHPDLEPILKDTYGTIVYQEQIMQVAQTLAGYSLGQADLLRRAMGKKKADVMAQERDGFVQGAVANGVDETVANQLFDTMSEFAAYCFNRSHSAAYAMVAFQTAYLKVHYPVEYLCALLSSVSSDLDKIRLYMQTARRMGIAILPPDVNASGLNFSPDYSGTPWAIRFGLASIKNVGVGVVESLIAARKEKPFATLEDFCQRVDPKLLNKKTLESLISCGALASFGYPRRQLLANIDEMTQYSQRVQQQKALGQVSLFSLLGDDASSAYGALLLSGPAEEFPDGEIQTMEKTLLGFYVTSHPLDAYRASLPLLMSHTLAELKDLEEDAEVIVGGLIAVATQKTTKTNRLMLVGQLEDLSSQVEFVAFHQTLERVGALLTEGQAILFSAKVQFRGDDADTVSLIVQHAQPLREVQPLEIPFAQPPRYEDLAALGRILAEHRPPRTENGNSGGVNSYRRSQAAGEVTSFGMPVILRFGDGTRIRTGPAFWVASDKRALLLGRLGQSPPC
jgi:DNA polymerase-3 subunit alpha